MSRFEQIKNALIAELDLHRRDIDLGENMTWLSIKVFLDKNRGEPVRTNYQSEKFTSLTHDYSIANRNE